MKYGQIESMRQQHPVATMCRILGVSESGYHAWRTRPPSARAQEEKRLEVEILAAHQRTRETCGPERLQADLSDNGVQVGIHRIKRIRKKLGLRCKQKRKFKVTTDSKHNLPVAPNRLDRQFAVTAPSRNISRASRRRCQRHWRVNVLMVVLSIAQELSILAARRRNIPSPPDDHRAGVALFDGYVVSRRAAAARNSLRSGNADAMKKRMRRVLRTTMAPSFKSLMRMV